MLRTAVLCLVAAWVDAFRLNIERPLRIERQLSPPLKLGVAQAAGALAPALASLPANALEDAAEIPDAVNIVLTVFVAGFVLFIGKFALEFATEVGSQTEERLDRLGVNNDRAPRQRVTDFFDETDFSYKDNQRAVENSRTRKKQSKQMTADGKRFAPWMVIDEKRVEQVKAQRKAAKKAKPQSGFKNPFG